MKTVTGERDSIRYWAGVADVLLTAIMDRAEAAAYRRAADGSVVTIRGLAHVTRALQVAQRRLARLQVARRKRIGDPFLSGNDKRILTQQTHDSEAPPRKPLRLEDVRQFHARIEEGRRTARVGMLAGRSRARGEAAEGTPRILTTVGRGEVQGPRCEG